MSFNHRHDDETVDYGAIDNEATELVCRSQKTRNEKESRELKVVPTSVATISRRAVVVAVSAAIVIWALLSKNRYAYYDVYHHNNNTKTPLSQEKEAAAVVNDTTKNNSTNHSDAGGLPPAQQQDQNTEKEDNGNHEHDSSRNRDRYCPVLRWRDEFDGASLDTSHNWEFELGDGCDRGLCGWGNNELQTYTRENVLLSPAATVGSGTLKIIATREEIMPPNSTTAAATNDGSSSNNNKRYYSYKSSRISSKNKADFLYGYIEARIKLPLGRGIWPAFWMMPTDSSRYGGWPRSGEIDICEGLGHEFSTIHGTVHYSDDPSPSAENYNHLWLTKPTNILENDRFADAFHGFGIKWTENAIAWYLDGSEYYRVTKRNSEEEEPSDDDDGGTIPSRDWPFDRPFHFILNVAVGGNWPGNPDETTPFPQAMEVDYVRVYDVSAPSFGALHGKKTVEHQQRGVTYSFDDGIFDYEYRWSVPNGAAFAVLDNKNYHKNNNDENSGHSSSILVDFGKTSGYVRATATSKFCGTTRTFSIPVKVNPLYSFEFAFVDADSKGANKEKKENNATTASLVYSSGVCSVVPAKATTTTDVGVVATTDNDDDNNDGENNNAMAAATNTTTTGSFTRTPETVPETTAIVGGGDDDDHVIRYTRNGGTLYDTIVYRTLSAIAGPNDYVYGKRRFYMDVFDATTTTKENPKKKIHKIWIQLENSSRANPYNYPTGRHSRYEANLIISGNNDDGGDDEDDTIAAATTTTLSFDFLDRPDSKETRVDTIIIMFDPGTYTNETYYFDNLDSYRVVHT